MLCKSCGEELLLRDYLKLQLCRSCYVIDDMDRFVEVNLNKRAMMDKEKKDDKKAH